MKKRYERMCESEDEVGVGLASFSLVDVKYSNIV